MSRSLLTLLVSAGLLVGFGAVAVAGTLIGTESADTLTGTAQPDQLYGEGGGDLLTGLDGNDYLEAGAGDDSVDVRDGRRDRVECGPGNDTVSAEPFDLLLDCESVRTAGSG